MSGENRKSGKPTRKVELEVTVEPNLVFDESTAPPRIPLNAPKEVRQSHVQKLFQAMRNNKIVDKRHPIKLTIKTSLNHAWVQHGWKLAGVFEGGLRTSPELEKFAAEYAKKDEAKDPVVARGFWGDGTFGLLVKDKAALETVLKELKSLGFDFDGSSMTIIQRAETILKDPKIAGEDALKQDRAMDASLVELAHKMKKSERAKRASDNWERN